MKQKTRFNFWKYRLSAIGPWMADISVLAPKMPYRSILSKYSTKCQLHNFYPFGVV